MKKLKALMRSSLALTAVLVLATILGAAHKWN